MIDYLNINVPKNTYIYVISDMHEHDKQFFDIIDKINPSSERWIVSLGDVFDKGFGIESANKITNKLMELESQGIGFAIKGNHELKVLKKSKKAKTMTPQLEWWNKKPIAISFKFKSGSRVTCIHAGVEPKMQWDDLKNNIEIAYVRDVDESGKMIPLVWKEKDGEKLLVKAKDGGQNWHDIYDGRFGYIVAGHVAQKVDGKAKYYKYSCNIDSGVYETGILTCQEFDNDGNRGDELIATGPAAKPKLAGEY